MKVCMDCFSKQYPGEKVSHVSLGRECGVCKKRTDLEQLIVVPDLMAKAQ